ncbi:site-specific integrase [Sphingomicrobium sp. XHP0235]|uniref:site-specific integrase n=1 Tax=Sphingomicrobium aquimarinum TaxID=3133971 RepID=UPI0031FF0364
MAAGEGLVDRETATRLQEHFGSEQGKRANSIVGSTAACFKRFCVVTELSFNFDKNSRRSTDTGGASFSLDRAINIEDARELIAREPNPAYRALWRLLAFGGCRISEALHMWQCDVLPPSEMPGGYRELIVPILAHPEQSKYLGNFTRTRVDREQHLRKRYGLAPRTQISGYRHLGWKGMLEIDGDLHISEMFWSDPAEAASFARDYAEVRSLHSRNRTSEMHPYLWVNMAKGAGQGEPIAYAMAKKAFYRACERAGLRPSQAGRRLHGLRHLYVSQLRDLGLSDKQLQIALRHRSIVSQEAYGKISAEIRSSIANGHRAA